MHTKLHVAHNAELRIYQQARDLFLAHSGEFPATEPTRANATELARLMREARNKKLSWALGALDQRLASVWNEQEAP